VTPLSCRFLGRVPYGAAEALQERLVVARRAGTIPDALLFLEHPSVITLGRSADEAHVLLDEGGRAARGIEVHRTGRGGDVTFHGEGQLVGYPILALEGGRRDAHRYLRDLEAGLIGAVAAYGVTAGRHPGLTGVWVDGAKLAAIGVRIGAGWITSHGFALNVGPDLSGFDTIVPCGLKDRRVTSLAALTGREHGLAEVARAAAGPIAAAIGYRPVWETDPLAREFDTALSSPGLERGPR
jgi:lipoyl(octanoyl) transferase